MPDDYAERPDTEANKDRQFVTALARGLSVLRCWKSGDKYLGNRDIAARTGLPKPTVSRLTHTLTELGYLDYSETLEKYSLGVGVLALGHAYLANQSVREVARPLMQALAEAFEATVLLGTPDQTHMVVVEVCHGNENFQLKRDVGQRVPHCTTALGRAYLAALPASEREQAIRRLQTHSNGADWARARAGIDQACADYQRYGFVFSLGEWRPQVYAAGVPLVSQDGSRIFAINCSGPLYAMTRKRIVQDIGPRLLQMRDQIISTLGGRF